MTLTLDQFRENLEQLADDFREQMKEALKPVALAAELRARANATKVLKQRSGDLRDSIHSSIKSTSDGAEILLRADVPYARIHEEGGIIRPKRGRYLKIPVNGTSYSGADLHFQSSKRGGGVLISSDGQIRYILKEQVKITKRPFMAPALTDDGETKAGIEDAAVELLTNSISST